MPFLQQSTEMQKVNGPRKVDGTTTKPDSVGSVEGVKTGEIICTIISCMNSSGNITMKWVYYRVSSKSNGMAYAKSDLYGVIYGSVMA